MLNFRKGGHKGIFLIPHANFSYGLSMDMKIKNKKISNIVTRASIYYNCFWKSQVMN